MLFPLIPGSGSGARLELKISNALACAEPQWRATPNCILFTMPQVMTWLVLWTQSDIIHTDASMRPHGTREIAHYFPLIKIWVVFLNALEIRPLWVGVPSGDVDAPIHDDSPALHPPLHHGRRLSPLILFRVIALCDCSLSTNQVELVFKRNWAQSIFFVEGKKGKSKIWILISKGLSYFGY